MKQEPLLNIHALQQLTLDLGNKIKIGNDRKECFRIAVVARFELR